MNVQLSALFYVLAILGVGAWTTSRLFRWARTFARRRKERLKKLDDFEAVSTESPLDEPEKKARRLALRSIERQFTITRRLIFPLILGLTVFLAILPFLDRVPAATLSLFVGAITVVTGIAARPFVENLIAGLVISASRVLKIGDTVALDDEFYGTVEDISLTHTSLKSWDWRRLVVPNARMLQQQFTNFDLYDSFQWAHVEFWVAPNADMELVRRIALEAPRGCETFADYEEPRFWIMEMAREGARCWVVAWANSASDAWRLKCDTRTRLLLDLRKAGISTHCHFHAFRPQGVGEAIRAAAEA